MRTTEEVSGASPKTRNLRPSKTSTDAGTVFVDEVVPRWFQEFRREVLAEFKALRDVIEQSRAASVSPADWAICSKLFPAVIGADGSVPFLAGDLADDDRPALKRVTGGLTGQQIGMLFARVADIAICGYLVTRAGSVSGSTYWKVLAVAGDSGDQSPLDSLDSLDPGGNAP